MASNRGPLSYLEDEDGALVPVQAGGGLVSGIAAAAQDEDLVWVCAALTHADRQAVRTAPGGVLEHRGCDVRMLDLDLVTFDRAYNSVANSTLWFAAHLLWDAPTSPSFGAQSRRDWASYGAYTDAFAQALAAAAAPGARVLVQDYHLALVPAALRALRPDLAIGHFSHTPFAPPEYFCVLPDELGTAVLRGMLGADSLGFHSPRWADAFVRCCVELLGAKEVDGGVWCDGRRTAVSTHPLGVDGEDLRARADQPDVTSRLGSVRELVGDRQLVLRIDRTELSKNIVRGLEAYGELLRTHPEHRERVVHLAFAYPSRHDLPEYREYTAAVQRAAIEVNEEFATPGWVPVHLQVRDDYARSLAAYRLADVLVVNPLRDGMNLVAKEGPVLSERGLALVLSRGAGAADELGPDALLVNPFDVTQTAEALHAALVMPRAERAARTARLAASATARPPAAWLRAQLDALA